MRTRQKMVLFLRPSVRPASASVSSKLSKAPRAVRYMSGNATTTVAAMADCQRITSFCPKTSRNHAPSGWFGPKTSSSR